jgi:CheY-like chemotaxis protein
LEINQIAGKILTFEIPTDALNFLCTNEEVPEVIFLDLNMPVLNGFELLDELIKLPKERLNAMQVVVLTSSSSSADREKAFKYPCVVDYISKPLSLTNLAELKARMPLEN